MPLQRQPRLCPLTRCSTDRQQKPYEQRRAGFGTALLLFQRQPHLYPLCRPAAVTASARPPCYSGRSRERPAAARKQQGKKSGELFRAASARCKCRFSGSQSMFRRRPADWRQKPASSAGPPRYRFTAVPKPALSHTCAAPPKQFISQASAAAARRNDFHAMSAASSGHRHCRQPVNDGAIKGRINTAAAPARFWCHSRVGQVVSSTSPRRKHK